MSKPTPLSNVDCGSMPTIDTIASTSDGDFSKNGVSSTAIELTTPPRGSVNDSTKLAANGGVYVTRKRNILQKFDFVCKKMFAVYILILVGIWIIYTLPIIVFYASSISVSMYL